MDRRLTVIILVIAVVATTGATLSTATSSQTQPENDNSSMGMAVSSFMQVSVVEADSTVDREMWRAAFENADNESERTALLEQRSNRLSQELSSIRTQRNQLNGGGDGITQARHAALSARLSELRKSINNASRTANKSNVRSSKLATLRKEACTVNVSNTSTITGVSTEDSSKLNCPPGLSNGNRSDDADGNNTTETPGAGNGTTGNNTTETPGAGNGTTGNNTTETPGTETPQDPNNRTETPTGTGTPQETETPPDGTDTPTAAPTTTENNTSSIDTPVEITATTENSGISLLNVDSRESRVANQRSRLHRNH